MLGLTLAACARSLARGGRRAIAAVAQGPHGCSGSSARVCAQQSTAAAAAAAAAERALPSAALCRLSRLGLESRGDRRWPPRQPERPPRPAQALAGDHQAQVQAAARPHAETSPGARGQGPGRVPRGGVRAGGRPEGSAASRAQATRATQAAQAAQATRPPGCQARLLELAACEAAAPRITAPLLCLTRTTDQPTNRASCSGSRACMQSDEDGVLRILAVTLALARTLALTG